MKKILLLILMGVSLLGCHAKKETADIRYPDPPNKPRRMPSWPAVVLGRGIPSHPDRDKDKEENPKERKTERSGSNKQSGSGNSHGERKR